MSVYFFSEKNGKIKALAGVKSLVLPDPDAKKIEENIRRILATENVGKLCESYQHVLTNIVNSEELKEEVHHFNCLARSKTASFFHIRNYLLRLAFSSWGRNNIAKYGKNGHRLVRNILRYFYEYAEFHCIAYGYIEAHHLVLSDEEPSNNRSLYSSRINDAYCRLKNDFRKNNMSHAQFDIYVSSIVDKMFIKYNGISHRTLTLARYILQREIVEPYSWIRILVALIRHYKLIPTYIFSRINPNSDIKAKTGMLPGILSSDVTIDPVGFTEKKQYYPSQESKYKNVTDKLRADMLWYIASRTAVCELFKLKGVSKVDVRGYFKMLRNFSATWSPASEGGILQGAHIDNNIITIIYNNELDGEHKTKLISKMEKVVIRIYKKWITSKNIDFISPHSPHKYYFNCTYMHI